MHKVTADYTYEVSGTSYCNTAIHPGYSASNLGGHHELYDKLKSANLVRIRYNSSDPQEAYLIDGTYSVNLAGLFGGLLFFLAGLMFLLIFHFGITGNTDFASGLDVVK